jgi:hypothetical protein
MINDCAAFVGIRIGRGNRPSASGCIAKSLGKFDSLTELSVKPNLTKQPQEGKSLGSQQLLNHATNAKVH